MKILPNGCRYGKINVFPANWNTTRASIKKTWYIEYRFYDPNFSKKYPNGYRKVIKSGINRNKSIEGRQQIVKSKIEFEIDLLEKQGYNPILELFDSPLEISEPLSESEGLSIPVASDQTKIPIDDRTLSTQEYLKLLVNHVPIPATPFISALWLGLYRTEAVPQTINDIGSVIRGTEAAAAQLNFDKLPINEIRKKHIKLILEKCAEINPKWSNSRHNHYKGYLRKICKPLVALEAIEFNPVTDIDELIETGSIRDVLTIEERKLVNDHLYENQYNFWRFMQIFFHSGARETELMKVRESDVDLPNQRYKVLIKKRKKKHQWVWKVIKDIALPFWTEVLLDCKALRSKTPSDLDIYLFGKFLLPGYKSIRPDQIGRRWAKYVMDEKKGLGIKKKFYDIKHMHTTEIMDILSVDSQSIEEAEKVIAEHNGHTTTTMVKNVYDVGNKNRKDQRIRKVDNSFA